MRVEFVRREGGPERLVAEAEIVFDGDLEGLKLVGFSLWRGAEGDIYVTFPARAFGGGAERRFFDLLRSSSGSAESVKKLKQFIVDEFKKQSRP